MKKKLLSGLLAITMALTPIGVAGAEFTDGVAVEETVAGAEMSGEAAETDTGMAGEVAVGESMFGVGADAEEELFNDGVEENTDSEMEEVFVDSIPEDCPAASISESEKEKAVKAVIEDIIKETGITDQNTDLEKLCMIMRWFSEHTRYSNNAVVAYDAYSSLVQRIAICSGFSDGLHRLLNRVGIQNKNTWGTTPGIDPHAWVEVKYKGQWYICDATGGFIPGSFLEDYENYWYGPIDHPSTYHKYDGAYSIGDIPRIGHRKYLGAKGDTLYYYSNLYYANDGTGWKVIKKENIPDDLCGAEQPINTNVERISYDNSTTVQLEANAKTEKKFYITNEGAFSKVSELICTSSDGNIIQGEIIGRDKSSGSITVEIKAKKTGKAKIVVAAPNNVTCECIVEVKKQLPLKISGGKLYKGSQLVFGWQEDENGTIYYAEESTGKIAQGFFTVDGKTYFSDPWSPVPEFEFPEYEIINDCLPRFTLYAIIRDIDVSIDGQWYRFDKNGVATKLNGKPTRPAESEQTPSTIKKPGKVSLNGAPYQYSNVKLTWKKVSDAKGYQVYQYNSSTKKYTRIATVGASTLSYTVKAGYGKTLKFKVRAYNKGDAGTAYGSFSAVTTVKTAPAATTITKTTAGNGSVSLTWKKASGAEYYQIYRAASKNGAYSNVKTVKGNVLTYKNTELKKEKSYYYKIRSYRVQPDGKKVYSKFSPVIGKKTK